MITDGRRRIRPPGVVLRFSVLGALLALVGCADGVDERTTTAVTTSTKTSTGAAHATTRATKSPPDSADSGLATASETTDDSAKTTDPGPVASSTSSTSPPASTDDWPPQPTSDTACNGADELCERRFHEVVFPGTHNSMGNAAEGWTAPNQNLPLEAQLADGIRVFLLDTYEWRDDIHLCHSRCFLGNRQLLDAMKAFRDFMVANPREVITFIFEDYVPAEDMADILREAGLDEFAYTHESGEPWPTLGEMIESGERLVVSAERDGPPPKWYHHVWSIAWDTPFSFSSIDEFNCNANRGTRSSDLFLVNHWILDPLAHPNFAHEANSYEVLMARIDECLEIHERLPTFIAVDFHDIGDLFEVVDILNGLRPPREEDTNP